MKKIIFFLALIFMASVGYMSAQNLVQPNQEVTLGKPELLPENASKVDYTLKYYATGATIAGLGNANFGVGTFYSHGCINFTSQQMYNYAGGVLDQISFYFPSAAQNLSLNPSSGKVWIKNSLSGAVLYEQSCTVTPGAWNDVVLTTPYTLTTSTLVIGFSVSHTTTSGATNEIRPMPLTTTGDSYKVGGVNYIIGATVPNTNGAGATWNVYNTAGNLVIEGYVSGAPALPTNDLAASTVVAPALKWVGNPATYTVTVWNTGSASQNMYIVQILDEANTVLGSTPVITALASGAFANVNVSVTPAAAGTSVVRGKVVLSGDAVSANDISDPFTQKVYALQPMAYCNHSAIGGVAWGAGLPHQAAIEYNTTTIAPFVGKNLTAVEIAFGVPASTITTATVWIRSSLTGANLYEQTFTPVDGWSTVVLNTPYPITSANTFIGWSGQSTNNYIIGSTANTPVVAAGGHIQGSINPWSNYNLQTNMPYNNAIIGVVENAPPVGACDPATDLVVTYDTECTTAQLTWEAPAGKGAPKGEELTNITKRDKSNIKPVPNRSDLLKQSRKYQRTGNTLFNPSFSRGNTAYGVFFMGDYYKWDVSNIFGATYLADMSDDFMISGAYYDGKFYAYGEEGFYIFNHATGALINTMSYPQPYYVTGLAYDYTSNTMYGMGWHMNTEVDVFFTVNLTNGHLTDIKNITGFTGEWPVAFAIDLAGTVYILDFYAENYYGNLYSLNKANGVATKKGSTNRYVFYYDQSMAFDLTDGTLYWCEINDGDEPEGETNFMKINPANGAVTLITPDIDLQVTGLNFVYNTSTPGNVAYNIYRNGEPVATNITTTTYSTPITAGVAYTWEVKVACEGGGESEAVTVDKTACGSGDCNPVTNLTGAYDTDCSSVELSWTEPSGKGRATQTFSYTGAPQPVLLQPGTYEIEVWGADGGTASMGAAGKGGYSKGTINVTAPTTYQVYVGGKGVTATGPASGGWNGGGVIQGSYSVGYNGGSGGGGTDVRTTENTTYADRIIVAGGGGGATGYGTYTGDGGNGGGLTGGDGGSSRGAAYAGKGGTQTAGGAAATGGIVGYSEAGTFGVGGAYPSNGTLGGTAGGGGWYGGGSGHWGGAGGAGSGYIGGVTDGVTINFGGANFVANPDQSGNGYVRITSGVPTGTIPYNIYRNGDLIADNVLANTYIDDECNPAVYNTWSVAAVCPAGGESVHVSITLENCVGSCDPVENFTAEYLPGCIVELNWEEPAGGGGKSSGLRNDCITTPNGPNNGSGALTVDIIAGPQDITITSISIPFTSAGASIVYLYYRPGTACGFAENSAGWTQIGEVPVTITATGSNYTLVELPTPFTIPAGQKYGFYFVAPPAPGGGIRYFGTGTGTCAASTIASNSDLTIMGGSAKTSVTAPFTGGVSLFAERSFAGILCYTVSEGGGYNIYRDDDMIAQYYQDTQYFDDAMDPSEGHTWKVRKVCADGGLSLSASATLLDCFSYCFTPTDLEIEYSEDCGAMISWLPPFKGKKGEEPEIPIATVPSYEPDTRDRTQVAAVASPNKIPFDGVLQPLPNIALSSLTRGTTAYAHNNYGTVIPSGYGYLDLSNPGVFTTLTGTLNVYGGDYFNGVLYAYTEFGNFLKINSATGAVIETINGAWVEFMSDMAYDYSTNTMYGVKMNTGQGLYTINLTTGVPTFVTPITGISGALLLTLAIDVNGNMYGIESSPAGPAGFYSVNKATGVCTLIGSTGKPANYAQSMGFDHSDGTLYWSHCVTTADMSFTKIDVSTGAATTLASVLRELMCFHIPYTYNTNIAAAPTNVKLNPKGTSLSGNFSWTNPTQAMSGAPLTGITKMVVLRNGQPYQEITNATPGQNMSLPVTVLNAGDHEFSVYAVTSEGNGLKGSASAMFGDMCKIVLELSTTYTYWYGGGSVSVTVDGQNFGSYTLSSSNFGQFSLLVPAGEMKFTYSGTAACEQDVKIYDGDGEVIFASPPAGSWINCTGTGSGMEKHMGLFFTYQNSCGSSGLYNIYRDGELIVEEHTSTSYFDIGFDPTVPHTWCITMVCEAGETDPICLEMEACSCDPVTGLEAAYNEDCEILISWDPIVEPISGSITTPNSGNGSGAITLDIIAGSKSVTITGMETQFGSNITTTVHMYYRKGSACGFATNSAGWTLIGQQTITVTGGITANNYVEFPTPVTIPAGEMYGFYFASPGTAGIRYHNGATTTCGTSTVVGSNDDLTIKGGTGIVSVTAPFTGTTNNERNFSGVIWYEIPGTEFNVYRDGTLLAGKTTDTFYLDQDPTPSAYHNYCVAVFCETGKESPKECIITDPCPHLSILEGLVTNSVNKLPVVGASLSLLPVINPNLVSFTETQEQPEGYYRYPYVISNKSYNIFATRFGYYDKLTEEFEVLPQPLNVFDFEMDPIPQLLVYGVVKAANDITFIEGATVTLEGYDNYKEITNAMGEFDFKSVYKSDDPYIITVTAKGYQPYTAEVYISGHTSLGTIYLLDIPYSPRSVVAVDKEDFAHISWQEPIPLPPFNDWIKWCVNDVVAGRIGYDATIGEDMTMGIRFTPEDLEARGVVTGHKITKVAYGLGTELASINTMEIRIWEGGSSIIDAGTLVYTQPLTGYQTLPESTMAEFELTTPFTIDASKEIRIGWRLVNTAGYPFGRDQGPNVAIGKSDLFFCAALSPNWRSYMQAYPTWASSNILIKAFVSDGGKGNKVISLNDIPQASETPVVFENTAISIAEFSTPIDNPTPVIEEVVADRITPKFVGEKDIVGFKLWRLLPGQENDEKAWVILTNNPVDAFEYEDFSWADADAGSYKWAVKTAYHMDVVSEPAFSNTLVKVLKADFVVNITTNSDDTPFGAVVTLSNSSNTYTATAEVNTVTFTDVVYGTYNLKVTLARYLDYTAQVVISGPDVHLATLIEIIKNPFGLAHEIDCNNVLLKWDHELAGGKHLNDFNVYLNDALVAAGVKTTEYLFVALAVGDYTAGVQAIYSSGASDIITTDFKIDCVGIDENEFGYKIYPNPATNHLMVQRENATLAIIEIFNTMGMHIATYETSEALYEINVTDFASATYFIRITEGDNSSVKSFVKK